jgi:A/G-specific adenine glycosylase
LALRESARQITADHHGRLPRSVDELVRLPGVGRATASAVIVYAFDEPCVFMETNIRRVFLHHFFPDQGNVPDSRIVPLVEETLDRERPREWYYALTDYGTALAAGRQNPNLRSSGYKVQSRFEGSMRQLRGRILSALMERQDVTARQIVSRLGADARLREALSQLVAEGFLRVRGGRYSFR